MGFFDRIRHPAQGNATVTAATAPSGQRSPQEVRMTLAVTGIGVEPFTIEHEEKCHTDRWPRVGMTVPVVFDSEHHERLEVQWEDVEPGQAQSQSQVQSQSQAQSQSQEIPAEAQALVDQLTKAFPGAQVSTHVETKVVNLSDNPEAAKQVIGSVEAATGMDLDGDGRIGGSVAPPAPAPAPAPPAAPAPTDDTVSRLERLAALHTQGVLTDEEFAQQKARLLDG
jgi:hypothetical protein